MGALTLASVSGMVPKGKLITWGGLVFPALLIVFALVNVLPLSLILLLGIGFWFVFFINSANALIQSLVPDQLRGRVMSIYMMTWSLMPIALLPMGALVDVVGAPITVAGAGVLLLLAMTGVAVVRPELWRKDKPIEVPVSSSPQPGGKRP